MSHYDGSKTGEGIRNAKEGKNYENSVSRRNRSKGLRDKYIGRGLKILLGKKAKVMEREQRP